jgi:TatD DNase family protein
MHLVDSHSHFDDILFDADRDAAYQRALSGGILTQIVPAVCASGWPKQKAVCGHYPGLHPAYGLHPMLIDEHLPQHLEDLAGWITAEKPVAIGECGLDFFVENPDKNAQRQYFEGQISLAAEYDLPLIIHARRSVEEVINLLRGHKGVRGVLHSFSGSLEQAHRLLDLGFLMGFGGPVTYPGAHRLHRLVAALPLDSILLETDSPDQPDLTHRGKRNEPFYLNLILDAVSMLRSESTSLVAEATTRNAIELFGLPREDSTADC